MEPILERIRPLAGLFNGQVSEHGQPHLPIGSPCPKDYRTPTWWGCRIHGVGFRTVLILFALSSFNTEPGRAQSQVANSQLPVSLRFQVIGGDAGIALSAALLDLVRTRAVGLKPVPIAADEKGVTSLIAREYDLPRWVDLQLLVDGLCNVNPHVCLKVGDKATWRLRADVAKPPSDACSRDKPSTEGARSFVCIPNIATEISKMLLARRFKEKEASNLPNIVTLFTRGCDSFDSQCQDKILANNPRQTKAWAMAEADAGQSRKPANSTRGWWELLSGTVTLPAATIAVILPPERDPSVLKELCHSIEIATKVGNAAVRDQRSYLGHGDSNSTGIIDTTCRFSLAHNSLPGGQPQGYVTQLPITSTKSRELRDSWLKVMGWSKSVIPASQLLVGIWDGEIALEVDGFARDSSVNYELNRGAGSTTDKFPKLNAIVWIDPSPMAAQAPRGPCGLASPLTSPVSEHGTSIAGMLVGEAGLVPDTRVWLHQWDPERLGLSGPGVKWAWFFDNVKNADLLSPPRRVPAIANLSCAPALSPKGDNLTSPDEWLRAFVPQRSNQQVDVIRYAVAVAAGNRDKVGYPEDPRAEDDVQGYGIFARSYRTSGFISVVGLAPNGKDILRCKHIRNLTKELALSVPPKPEDSISDYCGFRADQDEEEAERPLVVFGGAYDVAAIGLGVARTMPGGDMMLKWGSSFAAPYVTALIADIYSATKAQNIPYNFVASNLVANRIRFTADAIDEDIVKYGRINAERAFQFRFDQIEVASSSPPSAVENEQNRCIQLSKDAGVNPQVGLELSKRPEDQRSLGVFVGTQLQPETLPLSKIVRLRRKVPGAAADLGLYDAFVVGPDGMLQIKTVGGSAKIPTFCRANNHYVTLNLSDLDSVTRCSFVENCR